MHPEDLLLLTLLVFNSLTIFVLLCMYQIKLLGILLVYFTSRLLVWGIFQVVGDSQLAALVSTLVLGLLCLALLP